MIEREPTPSDAKHRRVVRLADGRHGVLLYLPPTTKRHSPARTNRPGRPTVIVPSGGGERHIHPQTVDIVAVETPPQDPTQPEGPS